MTVCGVTPSKRQVTGWPTRELMRPRCRDLAGWKGETDNYEVRDESIVCKMGRGGVLFTEEPFGDFVVRALVTVDGKQARAMRTLRKQPK